MRWCVVTDGEGWRLRRVDDAGTPGPDVLVAPGAALPAEALAARPAWPDTATSYPRLRRARASTGTGTGTGTGAGADRVTRVARCHDVQLTEALLLGHEGRWREPRSFAAAWARLAGEPPPPDPPDPLEPAPDDADTLFTAEAARPVTLARDVDPLDALDAVHADQLTRIARARGTSPGFGLLVAAESAAALAAVEMSEAGLPWRADVHDALLTAALGPRPAHGGRPPRLQALAEEVAAILGEPRLNPDSQPELLRALRRAGISVSTTRRHELRRIEHPAVAPLLHYKELARLHAANGWAWREQWVRGGRFRPEYVPGGVVSGRWASRGGGALQIPKAVRAAVVADPGRVLVVADAGQLEPRVLAALSRDPGLVAATRHPDLYTAVAREALGRPEARADAKIGMLSAMYGGGTGSALAALTALRRRFPTALDLLERAARTGEDGGSVRSVLGRASPPPRAGWLDGLAPEALAARARGYGRFTRNFVVQASAADWASVLVAQLRTLLHDLPGASGPDGAFLVFFQHDEVVVEAPEALAADVVTAITRAGAEATRLVLGDVGVHIPLEAAAVRSYADKA